MGYKTEGGRKEPDTDGNFLSKRIKTVGLADNVFCFVREGAGGAPSVSVTNSVE